MKILFLMSHMKSGGSERTVAYLSDYLAQHGFDVTVLTLSGEVFYSLDERVCLESLYIPSVPKHIIHRFWLIAKRILGVKKFLKKNPVDVVFCMLPEMAKYVLNLHKKGDFRLITSERNNPACVTNENEIALKDKIFKESDGIVFQTKRAMEYYALEIQEKGIVIHNAVGNAYVYRLTEPTERKKKIVSIGRLFPQKDYDTLLEAFRIVSEKQPEFTLEIFGGGPEEVRLKKLAEQLKIGSRVIFHGIHKDAIVQAADAACYVMSSKHEGMPNALMEAMAAGLPCVSTDCPNGPAELIEHEKNGLLVPVGNAEKLAEAILKMIEDKPFAEACGKQAKRILETHAIDIKAKEYMEFIEKICNEDEA